MCHCLRRTLPLSGTKNSILRHSRVFHEQRLCFCFEAPGYYRQSTTQTVQKWLVVSPATKLTTFFFILVINQLDAQNLFYNKFISCLYSFEQHVLIVRRSKLYYTASGIITLKQVSGLKLLK